LKNKKVIFEHLGIVAYKQAWDYQEQVFKGVVEQKMANRHLENPLPTSNYLLFCQHPPVYTLGKTGKTEHLLLSQEQLENKHIDYFEINRGGDITFHGLGQIVVYPILDLDNFFTDIHLYLRLLEEAVIQTLAEYNIQATRIDKLTGVWIENRKICAMGVKASRWVTMHGIALNVNTDLSFFENIIPCGIADKAVTSLSKELGKNIAIEEVEKILLTKISKLFEMEIIF